MKCHSRSGQVGELRGLRHELLRVALAEHALPGRVRLADCRGGLRLRDGDERDGQRVAPARLGRARDALPHRREAGRDVGHAFLACQTITSLVRVSGPPWKSPKTSSATKPL